MASKAKRKAKKGKKAKRKNKITSKPKKPTFDVRKTTVKQWKGSANKHQMRKLLEDNTELSEDTLTALFSSKAPGGGIKALATELIKQTKLKADRDRESEEKRKARDHRGSEEDEDEDEDKDEDEGEDGDVEMDETYDEQLDDNNGEVGEEADEELKQDKKMVEANDGNHRDGRCTEAEEIQHSSTTREPTIFQRVRNNFGALKYNHQSRKPVQDPIHNSLLSLMAEREVQHVVERRVQLSRQFHSNFSAMLGAQEEYEKMITPLVVEVSKAIEAHPEVTHAKGEARQLVRDVFPLQETNEEEQLTQE